MKIFLVQRNYDQRYWDCYLLHFAVHQAFFLLLFPSPPLHFLSIFHFHILFLRVVKITGKRKRIFISQRGGLLGRGVPVLPLKEVFRVDDFNDVFLVQKVLTLFNCERNLRGK
jgi:hypothetical protein